MINARPDMIYFVKPRVFAGPYKVGCTSSIERRFRHINNASPFEMELICTLTGGRDIEGRIHAALLHAHKRCEWFSDCPEIRAMIVAIKNGSFDIAALPPPKGVSSFVGGKPQQYPAKARRFMASYSAERAA